MSFAMLEEDAVTKRPVSMRTPNHQCTRSPTSHSVSIQWCLLTYLHCEPLHLLTHAGSQRNDFCTVPTTPLHYCHPCITVLHAETCHVSCKLIL